MSTGWLAAPVDPLAVLAAYDAQVRRDPPAQPGVRMERDRWVTRVGSADGLGWNAVVWSDPDLGDTDVDAVVAEQVRRFRGLEWEWKHYSHDQPPDLPDRLRAAGLVPEPPETLMVAEVAELDLDVPPLPGVDVVLVDDEDGIAAMGRVHEAVFGGEHSAIAGVLRAGLAQRPRTMQGVVASAGGEPVAAGRVDLTPGTDFASLWGGGTLAGWRGRGVFRALVSRRAALAAERGFRYLQVDASADSRPILRRLGFVELATTTPWTHPSEGVRADSALAGHPACAVVLVVRLDGSTGVEVVEG